MRQLKQGLLSAFDREKKLRPIEVKVIGPGSHENKSRTTLLAVKFDLKSYVFSLGSILLLFR